MRHRICGECGQYRGRQVVDVAAQIAKKQQKKQMKQEQGGQGDAEEQKKEEAPLAPEALGKNT